MSPTISIHTFPTNPLPFFAIIPLIKKIRSIGIRQQTRSEEAGVRGVGVPDIWRPRQGVGPEEIQYRDVWGLRYSVAGKGRRVVPQGARVVLREVPLVSITTR